MISNEFEDAVKNGNLLRARIMIKDSLILDTTFNKSKEMIEYLKDKEIDIFVTFDNGILEDDVNKWNKDIMNRELVELVDNFSKERMEHVKRVIKKVFCDDGRVYKKSSVKNNSNYKITQISKKELVQKIIDNSKEIDKIANKIENEDFFKLNIKDLEKLEILSRSIIELSQLYRK